MYVGSKGFSRILNKKPYYIGGATKANNNYNPNNKYTNVFYY
jgi:hypothetical protein